MMEEKLAPGWSVLACYGLKACPTPSSSVEVLTSSAKILRNELDEVMRVELHVSWA